MSHCPYRANMILSWLVPLLAASSVTAFATRSSLTRGAPRHDVISSRQAHIQRDLLDVCAGLDVDLNVANIVVGHLDVCLCISLLPDFVAVDAVAQAAVALVGEAEVLATLEALINGEPGKQSCSYPAHASPICSFDWPCGFNCTDGYTPFTPPGSGHPTSCTCAPPLRECNGQCGSFPGGCGSAVPRRKRGAPTCAAGKTPCGIVGGSSGRGWECVDITSDLESCGGCMVPSPFASVRAAPGTDCSAIDNAASVACHASKCAVSACTAGYVPSPGCDSCVPTVRKRDLAAVGVIEGVEADVANLVTADEAGAAGVRVARDLVGVAAGEGLGAVVAPIVEAGEVGGLGAIVERDVDIVEALEADVGDIAHVAEFAAADVHLKRGGLLGVVAGEGLGAVVAPVAEVGEVGGLGAVVARDIDALVAEGVGAVISPIATVAEGGVVAGHVARDVPVVDAVVPVVGAAVGAVVDAVVPGVAAVGAVAGAGVDIL
ncbi:hypothetical protein AcW1_009991 [Taiwanofungus camphoratus]|nr:hypothetical protein AcW1_009991 [Antrodia cinnamomea]